MYFYVVIEDGDVNEMYEVEADSSANALSAFLDDPEEYGCDYNISMMKLTVGTPLKTVTNDQ
jgi:cephalosporin hydroxylase